MKSKILAILCCKCPKCWKGNLFYPINQVKIFFKMRTKCPNCEFKYEIEVGFFYGAMYAAYGLTVAWGIISFLLLWLFTGIKNPFFYMTAIPIIIFLLTPLSYRLSRSLWLHIFIQKK